uniref:Carbamoyltransferase n=1 Tax=candidate division WOR-3 bacterium TaxID=2052148 RepID=A0A7C3J6M8_UNCW3
MYILGLNIGHDATATLLKDGRIVSAIAEERVSRVKFHFGFPYKAIKECIRVANINGKDISKVVLSFDNDLKRSPFHYTDLIIKRSGTIDPSNEIDNRKKFDTVKEIIYRKIIGEKKYWEKASNYAKTEITEALKKCGLENFTLETADHHLCHAASCYYEGGKSKALIVTMDGAGDGLSATISIGEDGKIKRILEVEDIYSVGRFYSAITKFLGFKRNRHEGKITGLAAYGDPDKLYNLFKQMIDITEDGKSFYSPLAGNLKGDLLRLKQLKDFMKGKYYGHNYTNLYLDFLKKNCSKETKEDIAAAAQKLTEDLVVKFIQPHVKKTGIKDIVLAGGLFSNVKVNQRVLEIDGVESVFIHPNMGDGGTSAGACYVKWAEEVEKRGERFLPFTIDNVYYGPEYSDDDILKVLKDFSDKIEFRKSENIVEETAKMIKDKIVVGWFQGRMEYGPRALGNRSILFDPTDRKINDWLNKRLKRTEFMPFAPSCIYEDATLVFENFEKGSYPSYFMTITFNVKEEWRKRIDAVNHVDNTARPQTVKEDQNPLYYKLLKRYKELTGLPLFVNTSFNMHEEPILCSPLDAVRSLLNNCVDVLVIGNFIVKQKK